MCVVISSTQRDLVCVLDVYGIRARRYDPAAFDVWSSGVILFFMVAGDVVFAKLGGQICFRFLELIVTKRRFGDFLSPPGEIDTVRWGNTLQFV